MISFSEELRCITRIIHGQGNDVNILFITLFYPSLGLIQSLVSSGFCLLFLFVLIVYDMSFHSS